MRYQSPWSQLLEEAVTRPGLLHRAYQSFHDYSLGNQMLAMVQCAERELEPGPLNTYPGWKQLGRQVRKGEKALTLCMPVTGRRRESGGEPIGKRTPVEEESNNGSDGPVYQRFIYRANWFTINQTDGQPYELPQLSGWDKDRAFTALNIEEMPFSHTDGNVQGYAHRRTLAINPVAAIPEKTMFHELGHIALGHTETDEIVEGQRPAKQLREAEAESVALLCLDTLNLPGQEYARGYIQNWLNGEPIPERSAQKIFSAANRILKAGRPLDAD